MMIHTEKGDITLEQVAENGKLKRFMASAPPGVEGYYDLIFNGAPILRKDFDKDRAKDKGKLSVDVSVEMEFDHSTDLLELRWYRGYD